MLKTWIVRERGRVSGEYVGSCSYFSSSTANTAAAGKP